MDEEKKCKFSRREFHAKRNMITLNTFPFIFNLAKISLNQLDKYIPKIRFY